MNTVFFSFFISNGWRFKQVTHPILRIVDFKETNKKKKKYIFLPDQCLLLLLPSSNARFYYLSI